MKNVIITGATGMVGGIVMRECLNWNEVAKVTSIVRRTSGINHPKLEEVVMEDFLDYSGKEKYFENQDAAFFCLGAYTGAVSDDLFKKITVDFTNAFADAIKIGSPEATFCLLSGQGADQEEKSRISFARYKGMSENYLIKKNFGNLNLFRPGYIYPVEKREEPNLSYRIFRKLYPIMKSLFSSGMITSEELGKVIFKAGMEGANHLVLENMDIKKSLEG